MSAKPRRNELIVCGYIRDIEKQNILRQIIPTSIAYVVMLFYPWIGEFKWDQNNHGDNAKIINDKSVQAIDPVRWSLCISSQIIASDLCNWYEWEFKLDGWVPRGAFEFGFIATPIEETINGWNEGIGEEEHYDHFGINISTANCFRLYGKGYRAKVVNSSGANTDFEDDIYDDGVEVIPKAGDRFKLRIDFREKYIKLFYNDEFVNDIYQGLISDSVVPAVSVYNAGMGVTVLSTDYE